ncbi:MAG: tRNA (adenosine(37)-N6)-dimethylallyltransferase MiaA [candidate division WOR-3 bacterium]|nr:tRNA (adenosine(37)-N6)-dimethylallyltransferase MiaA [candidate division WOR-3 bacterium]
MKIFVLTGPTGVGKTEVAVELAQRYDLDIISADSRQIYRYFDIGTAKPDRRLRRQVKFYLIDFVEPDHTYSAAQFARDALEIINRLTREGRKFIIVGGSNFYLRALFNPFFKVPPTDFMLRKNLMAQSSQELYRRLQTIDPIRAAQIHPNDRQRIVRALEIYELTGKTFTQLRAEQNTQPLLQPFYVVLSMPKYQLYQRINQRFDQMVKNGLIDEIKQLRSRGWNVDCPAFQSYGYRELLLYLEGKIDLETAVQLAKKRTRDFARRQLTWLRSLSDVFWVEVLNLSEAFRKVEFIFRYKYNINQESCERSAK